jgi:transcriptional regulator with XRE-family HTH domain
LLITFARMSKAEVERERLRQLRRIAFGNRLRQLRAARNLSQEALCRQARVDRSFYSQVETGTASPTVDWLHDVADALHVSLSALFRDPP